MSQLDGRWARAGWKVLVVSAAFVVAGTACVKMESSSSGNNSGGTTTVFVQNFRYHGMPNTLPSGIHQILFQNKESFPITHEMIPIALPAGKTARTSQADAKATASVVRGRVAAHRRRFRRRGHRSGHRGDAEPAAGNYAIACWQTGPKRAVTTDHRTPRRAWSSGSRSPSDGATGVLQRATLAGSGSASALGCLVFAACAQQPATDPGRATHTPLLHHLGPRRRRVHRRGGLLLWSIFRYRAGRGGEDRAAAASGSTKVARPVLRDRAGDRRDPVPLRRDHARDGPGQPDSRSKRSTVQGSQWQWSAVYKNEGVVVSGRASAPRRDGGSDR